MEQHAQVVRLLDGNIAELRVVRASACRSCHNCEGRDACAAVAQTVTVRAENPVCAQPGELVTVQTSSAKVLLTALVVYLLPLLLFLVGYVLGEALGVLPLLMGGAGFAVAFIGAVCLNRRVQRRKSLQYVITGIEKE